MSTTSTRSLADRAGAAKRMIRALAKDPTEWDPVDLARITSLETDLQILRSLVVHALRDTGYTDGQIGEAMGISQQAVSKRWPGGGRYVGAAGRYRTPQPNTTTAQGD